jgi:hypothetical protein
MLGQGTILYILFLLCIHIFMNLVTGKSFIGVYFGNKYYFLK